MNSLLRSLLLISSGVLFALAAHAQAVNIWPGVAPGSETWTHKEYSIHDKALGTVTLNVVTPTLTSYLPKADKATGTSIIVAPGGAFIALAIDHEGHSVARWLQDKGIAAFVLKYRLKEKVGEGIPAIDMDEVSRFGIADGIQAIKVVRQHAKEWNISPDRVGFLGFSAGSMVTSGTLFQEDVSARPNFAAMLYGGPFGVMPQIPSKLPPMFLAWAQDDIIALNPIVKFHEALIAAHQKPEVHIFNAGGHGFGMKRQGTTSDHWLDLYFNWLAVQGLTKPAQVANQTSKK